MAIVSNGNFLTMAAKRWWGCFWCSRQDQWRDTMWLQHHCCLPGNCEAKSVIWNKNSNAWILEQTILTFEHKNSSTSFIQYWCVSSCNSHEELFLQAGAPAGACKDTGAPNRTSSSVNGNVYSGTIEFKSPASAASISNANIPSKFVGLLLLGLVLIIKPFWSFRHSFFLLMSLPRFFFVFNVSYVMGLQLQ